jgi:uncharacterized membrane protein YfcA
VHLDGYVTLAGAIVGFAVGLTGMGGGALMTPALVLLLHVQPAAAVSSDLVASVVMKPVGGLVHLRRRTVRLPIAGWLIVGATPAAFAGAAILNSLPSTKTLQSDIRLALGAALLLATAGIVARWWLDRRPQPGTDGGELAVRRWLTVLVGVVGGLVVGMTSVGSGSLMIVALIFLYPRLTGRELVGTDLVQSIPLVAAAALGQVLFGHVRFGLTVSLVLGAVPAVYLGARVSAVATSAVIRPALVIVLLLTGLKLLNVGNTGLGIAFLAAVAAAALVASPAARVRRTSC